MIATSYKHVRGMEALNGLLLGLPKEVRGGVLAVATKAAAEPLKAKQKRYARRSIRTGALYASIQAKVKNYKNTGIAVAIVGPDRGYYAGHKRIGKGQLVTQGAEQPSRYAHLIEYGHHVRPRRNARRKPATAAAQVSFVPPRPFVRPAMLAARQEMARAFDAGATKGIKRAITKIKTAVRK